MMVMVMMVMEMMVIMEMVVMEIMEMMVMEMMLMMEMMVMETPTRVATASEASTWFPPPSTLAPLSHALMAILTTTMMMIQLLIITCTDLMPKTIWHYQMIMRGLEG